MANRSEEGSVFKKGGKWYARLRYSDANGRRCEKKRTAPTQAAGWKKINELRAEVAADLSGRKTYKELDAFYRREYVHAARFAGGRKQSGFRQDLNSVERYLDRALEQFGDKPLDSITYDDLRRYKRHIEDLPVTDSKGNVIRRRSVSDVHHHLKRVRRLFKIAIEQGWMDVSPFDRGTGLIVEVFEAERTRVLTDVEEERLLDACDKWRQHLRQIIIFAVETACRRGEIQKLEWRHVDLTRRVIEIEATNTKTLKPRQVPITGRCAAILAEIREQQRGAIHRRVFNTGDFKTAFNKACEIAGLEDLHFHDLRHTAITRMLETLDRSEVMKISGHTQERTFMRYVNPNMASIADRLDRRRAVS